MYLCTQAFDLVENVNSVLNKKQYQKIKMSMFFDWWMGDNQHGQT